MTASGIEHRVETVRRFNRLYTRRIGVLRGHYLESPFSLTESRVIYELAQRDGATAAELARDLGLDAGYLSRLLRGFARRGLIGRTPSASDRRRTHLALTARGRAAFDDLDRRSREEVGALVSRFPEPGQRRLVSAMETIESLLEPPPAEATAYLLRPPRSGDFGWIIHRQGVLYAEEYGWNEEFEGAVAGIIGDFIRDLDPKRERCWVAERDGAVVGSVFVVRKTKTVAKLRLLYVEPSARGLGIGRRLVDECVRLARAAGYRRMTLWTQRNLVAARGIYRKAGFRLVKEEPHHSFGHDLVGETWELAL
ncbi:MAG: bifunctional helix-turn-helix transcriptional regulator/GNAT family N-acetyltransferase [Gemmatimonadales bacterium]